MRNKFLRHSLARAAVPDQAQADSLNHPLLRWETPGGLASGGGADAVGLIGQPDFGFDDNGFGLGWPLFGFPTVLFRVREQ